MRKLIIDREKWLRGEGIEMGTSKLLREIDSKQCCVGFYLEACGVEREKLNGVQAAHSLVHSGEKLPEEVEWLLELLDIGIGSPDALELYRINDAADVDRGAPESEEDRERKIAGIFARHEVEVEFIN